MVNMNKNYKPKKIDYFEDNENIFIHLSDNSDLNGIMHCHNSIQVSYVFSGSAIHTIQNTSYPIKKGDIILVNHNVPHCFTHTPNTEDFMTYNLHFTPDFIETADIDSNEFYSLISYYMFPSAFDEFDWEKPLNYIVKTKSREFHSLFKKIYSEYTNREIGYQHIIRAQLTELIIQLFREIRKQQPHFTQPHQELVEKAIKHMNDNYKSRINLEDIVSDMFVSKNYFRQIFKKVTGVSVSTYIQHLRINEARRLLENDMESSVSKIANKCGYNDMKFFYQAFKKTVGMTPTEYRQAKMKNTNFVDVNDKIV